MKEIEYKIKDNLLGVRIKELRESKNLSKFVVSNNAGIKEKTLRKIERGESVPELETLIKTCKALGVPQKVLFEYDFEYIDKYEND